MAGITQDDFAKLSAPFAAKDHEFNRGFIYIEETAVCSRIEEIDLSWEWKTIEMTFAHGMATVIGALTIKGVTRYGTGQQLAQLDTNGIEKNGEAYKGATTDALKRAARLFGIGRYLLQCPKTVKDYGPDLDKWLKSIARGQSVTSNASVEPVQTKAPSQPTTPTASTNADILRADDAERFPRFLAWAKKTFGMTEQNAMDALFAINGQHFKQATSEQAKDACEAWFFANKDAS